MDLETVVKRLDELENQLSSIKKAITSQNAKANQVEEKAMGFLDKVKEQNGEISRINSMITGLGQFDTAITRTRIDLNHQVEEAEKRIQLNQKMQENVKAEENKALLASMEKVKKDLIQSFDQKLTLLNDEFSKQALKIKDVDHKIDIKIKNEDDFKMNLNILQQEVRQNKKIQENNIADNDAFKRRNDEMRSRLDIINRDMKTYDNRLSEILATESERKQSYISFLEQQSITKNERDRTWSEWSTQFEETIIQVYKILPDLQNQQAEMKKTKALFDEVSQKFDRRANEITEMYRLMDEKFRKEWATYKSDLEKRWSNVSLIMEDKQGGSDEKFLKINERIVEIEDNTQEMQEALILMSREIQKGMQSLMNMVNGWMDAFGQIKSQK
jgi:chromosome segregation ATPase